MAYRQLTKQLSRCVHVSTRRTCSFFNSLRQQSLINIQDKTLLPAITWDKLNKKLYSSTSTIFNIQNETDFQERVLESATPVIVDFHATWCGPCKLLAPRLEKVVDNQNGDVILAKVDIDDNMEIAMQYGVQSVPTVIAVTNGKKVDQFIGLQSDDDIESFVERLKS